jgi:hypothetical protein
MNPDVICPVISNESIIVWTLGRLRLQSDSSARGKEIGSAKWKVSGKVVISVNYRINTSLQ